MFRDNDFSSAHSCFQIRNKSTTIVAQNFVQPDTSELSYAHSLYMWQTQVENEHYSTVSVLIQLVISERAKRASKLTYHAQ